MTYLSVTKASVVALIFTLTTATASGSDTDAHEPAGFANFIGTWTLKDDRFEQVWDGETVETLTIPNHITVCTSVTTASSLSCTVDAGGFSGQIFWVADQTRQTFQHLSHFGENRLGIGTGEISPEGHLTNRVRFSDEPEGTYRVYEYRWITNDKYWMMSRQYDANDQKTGNWYSGSFVRVSATN